MKKIVYYIVLSLFLFLLIGFGVTFYTHKNSYYFTPLLIIDSSKDINFSRENLELAYDYYQRDFDHPIIRLYHIVFWKKITIYKKEVQIYGGEDYMAEVRTYFNIRLRENYIISSKIDQVK